MSRSAVAASIGVRLSAALKIDAGDALPAVRRSVRVTGGNAALLFGAVALVQSRLTGQRQVHLRQARPGDSSVERVLTLDDAMRTSEWLDGISAVLAVDAAAAIGALRSICMPTAAADAAELIVCGSARIDCPAGWLASISMQNNELQLHSAAGQLDALAADALFSALLQAYESLSQSGDRSLGSQSILSLQQRADLLCRLQSPRPRRPLPASIVARLAEVVTQHGRRIALRDGGALLSYAECWRRSGLLAKGLLARGVRPGDVVGLLGQVSIEQVLATIAVLRVGAVVLPIDPRHSATEIDTMLSSAGAGCLVVSRSASSRSAWTPDVAVDCVSTDTLAASGGADALPAQNAGEVGFLLLSGRSDAWRRARLTQGALLQLACDVEFVRVAPGVRVLSTAATGTPGSVLEIWLALLNGGTSVLHDPGAPRTAALARSLLASAVDLAILPGERFNRLIDDDPRALAPLQQVLITGAQSLPHLRRAQSELPGLQIIHGYGHPECAVISTTFALPRPLPDSWQTVPLGRPVAAAVAHVLAPDGGLLPIGVIGDIYLGGSGLRPADDPEAQPAFIADPFGAAGSWLFRSGDRGRRLPDGTLERIAAPAQAEPSTPLVLSDVDAGNGNGNASEQIDWAGLIERYQRRTVSSFRRQAGERTRLTPAAASSGQGHPAIEQLAYPLLMERARGAQLWDLDGNAYIDLHGDRGSILLGWQPWFVLDALRRQIDLGWQSGAQHRLQGEVAERLCQLTGFERAALCASGGSALLAALQLARGHTGRRRFAIFTGCDHGVFTAQSARVTPGYGDVGHGDTGYGDFQLFDYGDEQSLEAIRSGAADFAAILVEPVPRHRPTQQSRRFLAQLVALARAVGALSIFDETMTGFRCAMGGARQFFAVEPDLAVYGESMAGGLPLGAVLGGRSCLQALAGVGADQLSLDGGHSRRVHPLAMAAASAVLEHVQAAGPMLQIELSGRNAEWVRDANRICRQLRAPIELQGFASWSTMSFSGADPMRGMLYPMLRLHGVHAVAGSPLLLTTAHREAECAGLLNALAASIRELQRMGVLLQDNSGSAAARSSQPLPTALAARAAQASR